MNIGPRADGTITDEETQVLLGTGKWLAINGEAIYGTRPWKIYGEGPTESASGQFVDQKKEFIAKDIRFTTKGENLYVITLDLPKSTDDITVKSLASAAKNGVVASVSLLGSKTKLRWVQNENGLVISPPAKYPSTTAAVFKVTLKK